MSEATQEDLNNYGIKVKLYLHGDELDSYNLISDLFTTLGLTKEELDKEIFITGLKKYIDTLKELDK